jgi:hypothetical protein
MTFPIMFHLTSAKNWRTIKKEGLLPKQNRNTKHGDKVVWLIAQLSEANKVYLLKGFSNANPIYAPIIIKINASHVLIYHSGRSTAYYTPEAIKPSRILGYANLRDMIWLS